MSEQVFTFSDFVEGLNKCYRYSTPPLLLLVGKSEREQMNGWMRGHYKEFAVDLLTLTSTYKWGLGELPLWIVPVELPTYFKLV
jgi:hypothetical protein